MVDFRKAILVFMVFTLAACAGYGGNPNAADPSTTDFYRGTEGVDVSYSNIPQTVYYYSEPGNANNEFEVTVDVENKGASWSTGAIFLSGYDPNLISFREQPVLTGEIGSCGISIGSIGFSEFGGVFRCDGWTAGGSSLGDFFFDFENPLRNVDSSFGNFNIQGDNTGEGEWGFSINWDDPDFDFDYWGRGRLLISLFDTVEFASGRKFVVPGKSYEYPGGGIDFFTYTGVIQQEGWGRGLDRISQPMLLTSCYYYSTFAAPLVCIDPDPYSNTQKVCNPRPISFAGSQGAPVAITRIEQENTPLKAVFRITIENVGRGDVYDLGSLSKCSPYQAGRVRPTDRDVVYLANIRIGNTDLRDVDGGQCTPSQAVRLKDGRGTITCTYPLEYVNTASAYETPLYVEAWYGYSETERRDILLKRIS